MRGAVRKAEREFLGSGFARVLTTSEFLEEQTLKAAQTSAAS
jgi:hypothetical protein